MGNIVPELNQQEENVSPAQCRKNAYEPSSPSPGLNYMDASSPSPWLNNMDASSPSPGLNCNEKLFRSHDYNEHIIPPKCVCQSLKEEVQSLRHQIKQLHSRRSESKEITEADWSDLERNYKNREQGYRAREVRMIQKVQILEECIRNEARSSSERIQHLQQNEENLKSCLVRMTNEHHDLMDKHKAMAVELQRTKELCKTMTEQQIPMKEILDQEKKRNKVLSEELSCMRKMQQENETRNLAQIADLQTQLIDLKKMFIKVEVTNSELREKVATLQQKVVEMKATEKESEEKVCALCCELQCKEEMVQQLEKRLEPSEEYSLLRELNPARHMKREEITDLKTANTALATALENAKECNTQSQQQFTNVALEVKRLADALLHGDPEEEVSAPPPETTASSDISPEEPQNDGNGSSVQNGGEDIVVGMALMPEIIIDQRFISLPSASHINQKQICEVPSEMRKLSAPPKEDKEKSKPISAKRAPLRKIYKERAGSRLDSALRARVRRIVFSLNARKPQQFLDAQAVDTCPPEDVPNNDSQPLRGNSVDSVLKADAFTETESLNALEKETGTPSKEVKNKDISVQVDDEMNRLKILEPLSPPAHMFTNIMISAISDTSVNLTEFCENLIQLWDSDLEFREGLDFLGVYSIYENKDNEDVTEENYQHFMNAVRCLDIIEDLFKPSELPTIHEIAGKLSAKIMNYHTKCLESGLYCTVYYPVKREVSMD